jgi:hypothetical protein
LGLVLLDSAYSRVTLSAFCFGEQSLATERIFLINTSGVSGPEDELQYTSSLRHMDCSNFEALVHGEAEDSHVKIATEAAISSLLPIMDSPDLWTQVLESRSRSWTAPRLSSPGQCSHLDRRGSTHFVY